MSEPDEGPIIEPIFLQWTTVVHRPKLTAEGRDAERLTLSSAAVRHYRRRIPANRNRMIVFN